MAGATEYTGIGTWYLFQPGSDRPVQVVVIVLGCRTHVLVESGVAEGLC